ncbi:MAG TPA: helix-hairpin-helix domain-containing protein [Nitrospirota bacterium]|nr:helix-hairpin-helix domain-containing protein [Nitrospirota bacterium]
MRISRLPASAFFSLFFGIALLAGMLLAAPSPSFAAKKEKAEKAAAATAPVDINSADEKAIEALPGIGKKIAKAIIAGRPYKSADDLKKVKGMSDKKIKAISDKITFGAASAPAAAPAPVSAAPASAAPAKAEKPAKEEKAAKEKKPALAPGEKVNINSASKEDLDKLPGIGPVKAQAIIDNRPYSKPEDIMKVKGIKEKEFEKIRDLITVR